MPDVETWVTDHPSAAGRRSPLFDDADRQVTRALAHLVGFDPDVLGAVRTLRALEAATRARYRAAVIEARALGYSWDRIGRTGDHPGPDQARSRELAAFLAVLGPGEHFVDWVCGECDELVRDWGPAASSAIEAEQGHGAGCCRVAAVAASYRRRELLDHARS